MLDQDKIKADFEEYGFVAVNSQFSTSEIYAWRDEADRLWSLPEIKDSKTFRVDGRATVDGNRVPERLDPVTDISPLFAELAQDRRILSIVTLLLGEAPILFKDKLIVKPPGAMGYPLHQDFAYIDFLGFEGSQQLAACMAIDDTEALAGPIEFFPNRHHQRLSSPAERPGELDESTLGVMEGRVLPMKAGDMVLFHSLCPHRSAPNSSAATRRLLFFTYNTLSSGDFYETYYEMNKP